MGRLQLRLRMMTAAAAVAGLAAVAELAVVAEPAVVVYPPARPQFVSFRIRPRPILLPHPRHHATRRPAVAVAQLHLRLPQASRPATRPHPDQAPAAVVALQRRQRGIPFPTL